MSQYRQPALLLTLFVITCSFMSCSRQMDVSLPFDAAESFSVSGEQEAPDKWWTAFEDQNLNALVDTALESNFNLRTAWQRLQAANAMIKRERSYLFPAVDASADAGVVYDVPDFTSTENYEIGLRTSYEIDIWGRIRAIVQAEKYRADATYADYKTAAISISAEIVRTWYQLVAARNQLAVIEEQIETNQKVLDLLTNRFGTGQIRSVDILRQRQLLEATREQKTYAESDIGILEHRLAVLTGHSPQREIEYTLDSLPGLPPLPATGVPSELIQQRPDVQSAFYHVQAADRDLAAAISNKYPRINLEASIATATFSAGNLFQEWALSLAGNLLAPLIYGRRLSAEVDRNRAVKEQRLNEYAQTVLIAYQEVEDALILEQKQVESVQSIEAQHGIARQTLEQLRLEYFNGLSNYLDVLIASDQEQQLRRSLISAKLILLEYRVALYRALAGGFETAREAEE